MKNYLSRLYSLISNRYIIVYGYRLYKYELRPKLTNKIHLEPVCVNSDGIKYELIYKSKPNSIKFNDEEVALLEYSDTQGFVWVSNQQGILKIDNSQYKLKAYECKPVTKDSIIIVSDRYDKGDDNGEFFYEWIINNKPEYNNVFFAISKSSEHYQRLSDAGFKLLDYDSKQFRKMYKQADVIVSSVFADYIENHRAFRYKFGIPRSRFICLQHGVTYIKGAGSLYNSKTKINHMIVSLEIEKNLMLTSNVWFENQLKLIGFSRINQPVNQQPSNLLYAPSWDLEAAYSSDITTTKLYNSITSLIANKQFIEYLKAVDLKLKVIIHPQLQKFEAEWKKLNTSNIEVVMGKEVSYRDELANCLILITDTSSVFFDAIFRGKNIIFYHPNPELIPQPEKFIPIGNVTINPTEVMELINQIAANDYKQDINPDFKLQESELINDRLWELVING